MQKTLFAVLILMFATLPGALWAAGPAGTGPAGTGTGATSAGPAEVVQAFNRALSARKLEDATALLAKGSVQFTLRAAHAGGTPGTGGVTSDLKTHWNTIGPVVFSTTTTYARVPKIIDTRVDGDVATVWVQVASETVERNGNSRKDNFSEVYLVVRTAGTWLIGAIADNRGLSSLAAGAPASANPPANPPARPK